MSFASQQRPHHKPQPQSDNETSEDKTKQDAVAPKPVGASRSLDREENQELSPPPLSGKVYEEPNAAVYNASRALVQRLRSENATLKTEFNKLEKEKEENDAIIKKLQEENAAIKSVRNTIQRENASYRAQLNAQQQKAAALEREVEQLRTQVGSLSAVALHYADCIDYPNYAAEVNHLVTLRMQYLGTTDDDQQRVLLGQALSGSCRIFEAIYVDLATNNIQKLYASVGPSHISWARLLFGDETLFNKFLQYEEELFRSLGLDNHAIDELRKVLSNTRERINRPVEPLQVEEFRRTFDYIHETVCQVSRTEMTQANWQFARKKITQTLSIVATVANAAGPFVYPYLSTEVYAASVTLGGLGLTLSQ